MSRVSEETKFLAESYECDMEFYCGAEGNNLIILLYFYPER